MDGRTGLISTVAGKDPDDGSDVGDGGLATEALLNYPYSVAVGPSGNPFIAENTRMRRVDLSTGIIETVAGTGTFGFSGDGGPALAARVAPVDICLDREGHLYLADWEYDRIRRVDAFTGIIETVAVGGSPAAGLGDGEPATSAGLNSLRGVLLDEAGNLFIADTLNNRIRRVDAANGIITTVAGGGGTQRGDSASALEAQISNPFRLAWDRLDRLLIAQPSGYVRRVKLDGTIRIVAGIASSIGPARDGGPALEAGVGPTDLAVDAEGSLYIADARRNRIRLVRRPIP